MPRNYDRSPRPSRVEPPRIESPRQPGTHETRNGNIVHTDNTGHTTIPTESRITDVHVSRNGNEVIEHRDGIREVINSRTGHETFTKIPQQDTHPRYIAPSNAPRQTYSRNEIKIVYNEHNTYLRERNYVRSEPVFYSGYRWQPPVFAPILFAGATLLALESVYSPSMPRASVFNMTGVNGFYAQELANAGVGSTYDLVSRGRSPYDREILAEQSGVPVSEIRKAVGQADLTRVYGIGPHNSRLLVDAGISSVQDLARYAWDPETLYDQLKYSSFYDGQRAPSRQEVANWIDQARNMPVAIYD
jgi:hypothetical protein